MSSDKAMVEVVTLMRIAVKKFSCGSNVDIERLV